MTIENIILMKEMEEMNEREDTDATEGMTGRGHSDVILSVRSDSRAVKNTYRRFDTPAEAEDFATMLMTTDRRFVLMDEQTKDNGYSSREYVRTDEIVMIRICHGVR